MSGPLNDQILLEVLNLKKYFPVRSKILKRHIGWIRAVDGVSFRVEKGEIFGLVGESGCGKSTLGKTIHGIYRPHEGRVRFEGNLIGGPSGKMVKGMRNRLQYVYQDPGTSLDPWWTIRRTLMEPLIIHTNLGKFQIKERIRMILREVGLREEHLERFPHEFSGGQQRRLGLARILTLSPSLITFDEPTSGLDVSVQATILKLLKKLKEDHDLTYIFISHNLAVIRMMCQRVGVMYLGKLVEVGLTEKLFQSPKHPYTQFLLAAIPEPGVRKEDVILQGEPPNPEERPGGCCFWPRCQFGESICRNREPELEEMGEGHSVACNLAGKLSRL